MCVAEWARFRMTAPMIVEGHVGEGKGGRVAGGRSDGRPDDIGTEEGEKEGFRTLEKPD